MSSASSFRKSDWILLIAGVCGMWFFVHSYDRIFPDAATRSMISREEALVRSERIVRSPLVLVPEKLDEMNRREEIEEDEMLTQFLQERHGLESSIRIMETLSVFSWRMTWLGNDEGNVRIGRSADDESDNAETSSRDHAEVVLDGKGDVLRLSTSRKPAPKTSETTREGAPPTLHPDGISSDSARQLAFEFIGTLTSLSLNLFTETNVKSAWDNHDQNYEFTFTGKKRLYDLEHTVKVGIRNSQVYLFESKRQMPKDFVPHKDRWLGASQQIMAIIMLVLFSLISIIYFFRRFRSGAFDYKLGIFFGVVSMVAFSGMMILMMWNVHWLAMTLGVVFGGSWWALATGVIVVVGASLTRDTWADKYQTFEAIRRGHVFNRQFGLSVLRGVLWSFATLGLVNAALWNLPGTSFLLDSQSQSKFGFQGALFLLFAGVYSAIIHYHLYALLTLSAVRRRWKNPVVLYGIGILVNFFSLHILGSLSPFETRLVVGLLVSLVTVHILIQYDFLTLIVCGLLMYVIQEGYVFFVMGDIMQATVLIAFVAFVIGVGISGLLSRQSGEEVLEYVPDYIRELESKQRMHREFEIARHIQTAFLCCKVPQSNRFQVATVCDPAYEVGGDYYDFINFGDSNRKLGVIIGDVSGKGVSAAFYMTLIKGIMQTQATHTTESTRDTLVRVNDIFYEHVERGKFVSMIYAIFDFERGALKISRAGHNPVLIKQSGKQEVEHLLPDGIAIGLARGKVFADSLREVDVPFKSGDVFAFYTDGFSEAMNKRGEEFGEEKLYEVIQHHAHETPQQIMDGVREEVGGFVGQTPQHDDMTMIVVKIT